MPSRRSSLAAIILLVPLGILISPEPLAAQPPRPAVALRQHPTMLRSVWPADFNRDGHIDFVAGEPRPSALTPGRVVVRLGNGGGGVGQPIATGVTGRPATIGDFNGDRLVDVVAVDEARGLWMLAGRGNGTFQTPQPLGASPGFLTFALAADMNGDGRLDLVLGADAIVQVRPGRGDLTFGAAVTLPPGSEEAVTAGAAADFNRDGRRDLVVAQQRRSIIVYRNTGALIFTPAEIVIEENEEPDEIHGLTAADLNGDGRTDLVVPHAEGIFDFAEGGVDVLMGRGDGTFAPAVRHATGVTGPMTATTGDFNRDGIVDVAVGGRSWSWNDLTDVKSYWDSVAIFPGRGNGLLERAAVFRLDTRVPLRSISTPWVNQHHALRTADVNGDGEDDLVASPLAILLNRPVAPNRPPTADAAVHRVDLFGEIRQVIAVRITEPDWDWLRVEWRGKNGRLVSREPSFEYGPLEGETLTVTVTDFRGATATDTVVVPRFATNPVFVTLQAPEAQYRSGAAIPIRWTAYEGAPLHSFSIEAFREASQQWVEIAENVPATAREFTWNNAGPPGRWWLRITAYDEQGGGLAQDTSAIFTITTTLAGAFPWPWQASGDVGAVGQAGSATYSSGVFTVRGAGSGVSGPADEFHYVEAHGFTLSRFVSNFSVTARVTSLEDISDLTKAGLMIREGLGAASRHVSLLVSPTSDAGVTFERRTAAGGSTVRTRVAAIAAPTWLKLVRRFNGDLQADVIRAYVRKNRTDPWRMIGEQIGPRLVEPLHVLLVASSGVDGTPAAARFDNVEIAELESMSSFDFGATIEGRTTSDGVTTTVEGDGANIWGRADAFRYNFMVADLTRGGSITVRVRSLENTHSLAKAGIMIRNGADPGAAHVSLFVTPGGGVRLEYRPRLHEESARFALRAGTAPEWLRLTRNGNVFTAFASDDGATWNRVGAITLAFYQLSYVGLAVTSHSAGTLATAVFDDLAIRP